MGYDWQWQLSHLAEPDRALCRLLSRAIDLAWRGICPMRFSPLSVASVSLISTALLLATGAPPMEEPAKKAPEDDHVRICHDATVSSVEFSPDGKRIATGTIGRGIGVWEPTTGK